MIDLVIGGQYGSEGKGSVVLWLTARNKYDLVIRTGGSQAGHTMVYKGKQYKMRMIPCAWHTGTRMAISKQAVVNEEVFINEVEIVSDALGIKLEQVPIRIHPLATLLDSGCAVAEKNHSLDKRIGSTLEGVGEARSRRILRSASIVCQSEQLRYWVQDYDDVLFNPLSKILIESTQGWGLSLFGKHYPFATSADLNPYSILADAGIPFGLHKVNVIGVLRTFPIRVGGNSGELMKETTWEELREAYGEHIPDEYTTVTKRKRRIGLFEWENAKRFCRECNPSTVFLTFCDYLCPELLEINSSYITPINIPVKLIPYLALLPNVKYFGIGIGKFLTFADWDRSKNVNRNRARAKAS